MSTHEQPSPTVPTSVVRNTRGRSGPQHLEEPTPDKVLRELCNKNYHQLLPLIAEKMQKEKEQQDKLNAVKAHLLYGNETGKNQRNHEESHYSESKTPTARTKPKRRHENRCSRSPTPVASEENNEARLHVLAAATRVPTKGKSRYNQGSIIIEARRPGKLVDIRRVKTVREVTGSPNQEVTWTRDARHVKTYDGKRVIAKDQFVKAIQAVARQRGGQCNMGKLSPTNKTHQRSGRDTSYQAKRWRIHRGLYGKIQSKNHGCGRSAEMHEDLRIHARYNPPQADQASAFIREQFREGGNKQILDGFSKITRSDRKPDRFSLLTKTPKEIFALEKGKFKAPPPMVTPAEKRDPNKYCEFHADTRHSTDECMQLRKQIDEMIKSGKFPQFIKELKQSDKPKVQKKGETARKDKPLAILMIKPWERVAKKRVTQSFSPKTTISFSSLGEEDGTEAPMIIEAEIGGHFVHRIYVDGGFSGETIWPIGQISLLVKIGDEEHSTSAWMNFMVIRSPSQHNGIIGRTGIRKIHDVPSTAHRMLKFPVKGGTVTIRSSKAIPMECAMIFGPTTQRPVTNQVSEEKIKVVIHPEYPEQTIAIGSTLTEKGRKELCALLKQNLDIFAWKPADMTGVLRHMAEHRLNVREGCPPVRQKKRGQAPKRNKAIQEEVEKLVDARIMKEVHYHSWLSNPIMVKKHDGSWRMCVDFKDLNKACPQDGYPLPEIDWKVESLCGYPFKCFLDAYKGYHQIKMAEKDEEKIAFITSQGIFCYTKMSFGLKNSEATYQRLVNRAFQKQIGYAQIKKTRSLAYHLRDALRTSAQKKRFPMDSGSRSSLQTDEETHSGTSNADRTKGKGRANHVPSHGQENYQRSLND
ncbi:reverse transcriptase domain-containing protein [Tanacetum coccineum]